MRTFTIHLAEPGRRVELEGNSFGTSRGELEIGKNGDKIAIFPAGGWLYCVARNNPITLPSTEEK